MIRFGALFFVSLFTATSAGDPLGQAVENEPFELAFRVEPSEVEVGQPFELLVAVRHASGTPVPALDASALPADPLWVVLDERRETAVPDAEVEGFAWTRFSLSLAALEPGEHVVPVLELSLGGERLHPFPDLAPELVFESLPRVTVGSVLAEGEDAPRPLRGLEEIEADLERSVASRRLPLILGSLGVLVALLGLAAIAVARRRRRAQAPVRRAPEVELERIAGVDGHDAAGMRDAHYDLTRLVRDALDRRLGQPLPGLVDEEWATQVGGHERLRGEGEQALAELFARCRSVKYGGALPTEWAVRETFEYARRILALTQPGSQASAADKHKRRSA